MRRHLFGMSLMTLVSLSQAYSQTPAPAGRIAGTVVASDNTPVARVSVMVQSQRTPGTAPFRASVFTQPDGSFVVPDVPPGNHRICIQAPGTALLNPCAWSAAPPSITVVAGQPASTGTIRLETGHLVKVRLLDAARLLEATEGRIPGAQVQIGVWTTSGFFIPMRIRTRDATSRELELPVPFGAPLSLSIQSSFYDLTDAYNVRVDPVRGALLPLQVPSGTPPTVHAFSVTGRRAATGQP